MLNINSLDYPGLRENLISFLKAQRTSSGELVYQDFNFSASGISTLINLLAYHGHFLGYYIKMMLNESFIDSAARKESLFSKAKLTGYVPRGKRCARASLSLSVTVDKNSQPSSYSILIPKGTSFSAANNAFDQRVFYTIDDVFISPASSTPTEVKYTSDSITVYEGKIQKWRFKIDNSLLNQRFVIKDKSIDIDTIRILVTTSGSGESFPYLFTDTVSLDQNDRVFYLSTNEEGYYEIVFGDNVFGKAPDDQSVVEVVYISSSGESGNGCKNFIFNAPSQLVPIEHNIGNWEDFSVILPDGMVSSGGAEPESIDSLRFTIPHHYRRQNRLVTVDDYRSMILSEFRHIESINVWGGEQNVFKDYGKIYLSMKPKFSDRLTSTAKREIENKIIEKHGVIGMQPVIVDPEFIDVSLVLSVKVDHKKTNRSVGEIERVIIDSVNQYNTEKLNVFDNFLSDVDLMNKVLHADPAIKSAFSKKTINKSVKVYYSSGTENTVFFGNGINPGVSSSEFVYGDNVVRFKDDSGKIFIYKEDGTKLLAKSFGSVDYQTGIIRFIVPDHARSKDYDFTNYGLFDFLVVPSNSDIESFLQNIIRIKETKVIFK